jgi:LytS/YehU family sensor histidine kinase
VDLEQDTLIIKTRELIEHTRREISQLRDELQSAWNTVDQSQRLLSRAERQRRSLLVSSIKSKAFKNKPPS